MSFFTSITMNFIDGNDAYNLNDLISMDIDNIRNEIIFKGFMDKNKPVIYLPLKKLTNVTLESEREISEKSKSVIGRAVLGGLIAGPIVGPVGAVVGGISGIGNKKVKGKKRSILTIEYTDGELVFIANSHLTIDEFYNKLKKHIPQKSTITKNNIRL